MEKYLSRLTLTVSDKEFEALLDLALEANTSITDMLCMFITDLVGPPDTTEDFHKYARGWYDTLHSTEQEPLEFPVWLKRNNYHKAFFCLLSTVFTYVKQHLKCTFESSMSFDEMCMEQVEYLVECRFSPEGTAKGDNDLHFEDFPLAIQDRLSEIFDTMAAFYTQYIDDQKVEETRFSCEMDMTDVVHFWRDYMSRYDYSAYLK